MTWAIDDGQSNQLCAGIQFERRAREIAQELANKHGESVFLYESGSEDLEEIEPVSVVEKLRRMVTFFDSVNEEINEQIGSLSHAEKIYDAAQCDNTWRHNNDIVRELLEKIH